MIKNSIIALVTVAALAGVAVPAYAEGDVFGDGSGEMSAFVADSIVSRLQAQGVNATGVEEWGGLIRAFVILDDGSQAMQLYTPGLLEQVTL